MIRPNDVDYGDIERAKNFIRKPLSEQFKAWATLRDHDHVTMKIHELAHLMAWYAALCMERRPDTKGAQTPALEGGTIEPPLPEPSSKERLFLANPLGEEPKSNV